MYFMSTGRMFLGILAAIAGMFMIRLGSVDDAPGAGLIGIVFIAFGIYLILRNVIHKKHNHQKNEKRQKKR